MRWTTYVLYGTALAMVVAAAIAYGEGRGLTSLFERSQRSAESVRRLEAERARLAETCQALEERVAGLESDPVEIEAAIRMGKNLVRTDERVYRIVLPEDASLSAQAQP